MGDDSACHRKKAQANTARALASKDFMKHHLFGLFKKDAFPSNAIEQWKNFLQLDSVQRELHTLVWDTMKKFLEIKELIRLQKSLQRKISSLNLSLTKVLCVCKALYRES